MAHPRRINVWAGCYSRFAGNCERRISRKGCRRRSTCSFFFNYKFPGGTMALTFSLVDTWDDGQRIHVAGTPAWSGSYSPGGDTLDLSQFPVIAATQAPVQGTAWMDGLAGYDYVFYPGSAMNNGKVKIFQQGASAGAFPELAAGAYPSAISADTITFYGIFKKML